MDLDDPDALFAPEVVVPIGSGEGEAADAAAPATNTLSHFEFGLSLVPRWKEGDVIVRGTGIIRIGADIVGIFRCLRDADGRPVTSFPHPDEGNRRRWWPLHCRERSLLIKLPPNLVVLATCPWVAHRLSIRQAARNGGICELLAWRDTVVQQFVAEVVRADNPYDFAEGYTDYGALAPWLEQARANINTRVDPPHGPVVHVPLDAFVRPRTAADAPPPTGRLHAITLGQLLGGLEKPVHVETSVIGRDELVACMVESVETYVSALNTPDVLPLRPPRDMSARDAVPTYDRMMSVPEFFQSVLEIAPVPPGLAMLRYRISALLALHTMVGLGESLSKMLHSTDPADQLADLPDHDLVMLAHVLSLDSLEPAPELDDAMDLDVEVSASGVSAPSFVPKPIRDLLEDISSPVIRKFIFSPAEGKLHVWLEFLVQRVGDRRQVVTFLHALAMSYRLWTRLEHSSPAARVLIRRRDVEYQLKFLPSTDPVPNRATLLEYLHIRGRRQPTIPAEFYSAHVDSNSATLLLNHEPQSVLAERIRKLQRRLFGDLYGKVVLTSFEDQLDMPLGGPVGAAELWLNEHRSMSMVIIPAGYAVQLPTNRMGLTLGPNGTLGLFVTDREFIEAVDRVNNAESARILMTQCLYLKITDAHVYPVDRLQRLLDARFRLGAVETDEGSIELHGCPELLGSVPEIARPMTPALLALRQLADSGGLRIPLTDELVGQGSPALLLGHQPILAQVVNKDDAARGSAQTWLVGEAFQLTHKYMKKRRPHQLVRLTQPLIGLPGGKLHIEYSQFKYWLTVDELATLCYLIKHASPSIALVVHAKASEMAAGTTINLLDSYSTLVCSIPIPRHRLTNYWTTSDE